MPKKEKLYKRIWTEQVYRLDRVLSNGLLELYNIKTWIRASAENENDFTVIEE